jgi:hypothetical protein
MQWAITPPNDRLPAIAGLAKEFAKRTGFTYICGLWKEDFLHGLLWDAHGTRISMRTESWAPSWSWPSVTGLESNDTNEYSYFRLHIEGDDAEVINITVTDEDNNIFGPVRSAWLTLKGQYQ